MPIRCCIRVRDPETKGQPDYPVLLHHLEDEDPDLLPVGLHYLFTEAFRFQQQTNREPQWDAEHLAATVVLLSANPMWADRIADMLDRPNKSERFIDSQFARVAGVPQFIPCGRVHEDTEYLFDVWLLCPGKVGVECRQIGHGDTRRKKLPEEETRR